MRRTGVNAFTVIELLVVIGIIGILMAILLPAAERVRHQGYIARCAAHLHEIGLALSMYANDNHGDYPRTTYLPGNPLVFGTGASAVDPFGAGGPLPNDATANIYLLMRRQKLPASLLICPYNDVNEFVPDPADPMTRSNFTNYRANLGYSFANPYPDAAAAANGYRLGTRLSADFAVAADLNPGQSPTGDDVLQPTPSSPSSIQRLGLSKNHEKDGQNVLYADGHVQWQKSCRVGVQEDNIFTSQSGLIVGSPAGKFDSVLLPIE